MHVGHPGAMPDRMLYMIPEHPNAIFYPSKGRSPPPRPSTAGSPAPSYYPIYSELQPPALDRDNTVDAMPMSLKRPKKISRSSTSLQPANRSSETFGLKATSSPGASMASHHAHDSMGWRPSQPLPERNSSIKAMQRRTRQDASFASLPGEVLEVILEQLKELHLGGESDSCATCWMRDLCSLSLCSSQCFRAARRSLYEDIRLDGPDSASRRRKPFKSTQGSRMVLLRRTLRANPDLAGLVKSLKVPQPGIFLGPSGSKSSSLDQYVESVAALVLSCPKLERLSGPILSQDSPLQALLQALSTRTNLRDMNWLIEAPDVPAQPTTKGEQKAAARAQPHQDRAFAQQHRNWKHLSTLSIHCMPGSSLAPDSLATALSVLPALQHLHLSGLPASTFNDATLLSLPKVRTLTLSNIPGISSSGISSFATRPNSMTLEKLHLRHTPLTSLPAVARILSNLKSLVTFSLVQSFPPLMPETDTFVLCMMPYLASSSVAKLHWSITSNEHKANAADGILAKSIQAGGFPSLRTLRAPNDPEGLFQALCRPVERADLPGDRHRSMAMAWGSSDSAPTSPVRHLVKSPTASSLPSIRLRRQLELAARRRHGQEGQGPMVAYEARPLDEGQPRLRPSHRCGFELRLLLE
ncbi:hypothetical protein HIM_07136 [Hirsutella minnesotensis 3608]|uniref:F-box domain-containing protein n=1 Tax=Hirsutella minnesotensis 3608 TaxID=1043627 RepID=A0A0F7ZND9_9HYPO|nr:hypothetical protein HIM_07136 [Hirsutella minnesotensis 3608]